MDQCLILHQNYFHHQQKNQLQQNRLHTSTFNKFLNFIIEIGVNEDNGTSLQLMDEYYLSAKHVGIQPNLVTFNHLLRANRLCQGSVRGKLVLEHLREMAECRIAPDSYTIVELLAMCTRSPGSRTMNGTMTNKQVADAEFNYYLEHVLPVESRRFVMFKEKKLPPVAVFNRYLDVYVNDGDVEGMHEILDLAASYGIKTFDRGSGKRNRLPFPKYVSIATGIHELHNNNSYSFDKKLAIMRNIGVS